MAYLKRVTPGDNGVGSVTIRYKHAKLGAALVDAGMMVASREYARPEDWASDPFCLPRKLRYMATARFGFDFDDMAAHPHAQRECVEPGRDAMDTFLLNDNREIILRKFGASMWPNEPDEGERRSNAKAAFASFSMDGSWKAFLQRTFQPADTPPVSNPEEITATLPGGERFCLAEYLRAQREGTEWLSERMETRLGMQTFVTEWLRKHKPHRLHPERTLKSFILQDLESVSRDAKVEWCAQHGHAVLSAQHDGIVVSLRAGTTAEEARRAMQEASGTALGYAQPTTTKSMPLPLGVARTLTREETEASVTLIGRHMPADALPRPTPTPHALCQRLDTHAPYAHVEWDEAQKRVFTGIDGKDDWRGRAYQRASRTRALQQDPITRLFLRGRLAEGCQERKPRAIFQRTGIEATLDKSERETLVDNDASVWRSAHTMRIAMTLHAAHAFTHAAAIDGSKNGVDEDAASGGNEAEHNAEDRLAPTAYGVWEGMGPYGLHDKNKGNEELDHKTVGQGMWGGRLPDSCEAVDAELAACFYYLRRVHDSAKDDAERKRSRILILSDCKPAMQAMEAAWRGGEAHGMRKDRGAMLEAICTLRAALGRVITMWTPAHVGISPNSMADCAAKSHTSAPMSDLTNDVASHVHARPVIYERRVKRPGEITTQWELADRRPFAEGRKRARAYVRTRLSETVRAGSTSAEVEGRLWADVVRGCDRRARPEVRAKQQHTEITPEAVEEYNTRRGVVLGLRAGQVCDMQGGRMHQKRLRAEGGEGGPASSSESFGCLACKLDRDRRKRALPTARRGDSRQRAKDEWAEEEEAAKRCKPSIKHWATGACTATRTVWQGEQGEQYAKQLAHAHNVCKRVRDESTGEYGVKATRMVGSAALAARATYRGEAIDDSAWSNSFAVLAGCLTAWADDDHAHEGTQIHTREVTSAVMSGQALATEAAEAWRKEAAPAKEWMRHRTSQRGLLTLVFRCWRERVEYDTPGINTDSSKWHVRTERVQRVGPHTRQGDRRQRPSQQSDERKFVNTQLSNFAQVASRYTWNPWRESPARRQDGSGDEDDDSQDDAVDEIQLSRWRMKCDVMRVATYYRVTGARERAEARHRSNKTRARFRAWAASVIQARRDDEAAERAAEQARDGTSREARKRRMEPGVYREGRTNKQRATQAEVARRRLQSRRQRRGPTVTDTQVGKRMRDDMCEVATRAIRQRRERFGDG